MKKTKGFIHLPRTKEEINSLLCILLMDFIHEIQELVEADCFSKSKRIDLVNKNVDEILNILSFNLMFKKLKSESEVGE